MTLKIRSRSPKSNLSFPFSQQYVFASLVKIHPLVQKIIHGNHIFRTIQSAAVTLKIRSRSPKSNQLFHFLPTMYLCKFDQNPSLQKITHGNQILDISKCTCDLKYKVKVTKILINSSPPPDNVYMQVWSKSIIWFRR